MKNSHLLFITLPLLLSACKPHDEQVRSSHSGSFANSADWHNQFRAKKLKVGSAIFIRIFKESKELELWVKSGEKFELFKSYPIYYFSGNLGPKLQEGDRQAPEGFYYVPKSMMNPKSRFHLSFNVGFPNSYDRACGRTGSFIMVHGGKKSIGCFAMTDPLIDEIYKIADSAFVGGQKFFRVHIFPFRMTAKKMKSNQDSKWFDFWLNLKEGYDWFENRGVPPEINVKGKKYIFKAS